MPIFNGKWCIWMSLLSKSDALYSFSLSVYLFNLQALGVCDKRRGASGECALNNNEGTTVLLFLKPLDFLNQFREFKNKVPISKTLLFIRYPEIK